METVVQRGRPQQAAASSPTPATAPATAPKPEYDPQQAARSAWERNQKSANTPPAPLLKFRVRHGEEVGEIEAVSSREAWAKFNDKRQKWPGPRSAGIEITQLT